MSGRYWHGVVLTFAVSGVLGRAFAQGPGSQARPNDLRPAARRIEAYLDGLVPFGFSGAVVIDHQGSTILARGFGFADRGGRRPFTIDTPAEVASLSKQFTAAAILQLESRGRLALDDSLGALLPDVPPDKAAITVRQLLTHMSGLRYDPTPLFVRDGRDSAIRTILATPLDARPDSTWSYSNAGYRLLAAIAEARSGQALPELLAERLFRAAGLRRTAHYSALPPELRSTVAPLYVGPLAQGTPADWPVSSWYARGSSGVVSTAADLDRWMRALSAGTVLDNARARTLTERQANILPGLEYGFGWFVHDSVGQRLAVEHAGDFLHGSNAFIWSYPDAGLRISFVSNARTFRGTALYLAVQDSMLGLLDGRTVQPPPRARLVPAGLGRSVSGVYQSDATRFDLWFDGSLFWLGAVGQDAADVVLAVADSDRVRAAGFGQRSRAIFERLGAGDTVALVAALPGPMQRYVPDYVTEWRDLEQTHGPLRSVELLATVRRTRAIWRTGVRLTFARDTVLFHHDWRTELDGMIVGSGPDQHPYATIAPLGLVSGRTFASFDLATGVSVEAKVVGDQTCVTGAGRTACGLRRSGLRPDLTP